MLALVGATACYRVSRAFLAVISDSSRQTPVLVAKSESSGLSLHSLMGAPSGSGHIRLHSTHKSAWRLTCLGSSISTAHAAICATNDRSSAGLLTRCGRTRSQRCDSLDVCLSMGSFMGSSFCRLCVPFVGKVAGRGRRSLWTSPPRRVGRRDGAWTAPCARASLHAGFFFEAGPHSQECFISSSSA